MEKDDYSSIYDEEYTYDELNTEVQKEYDMMSEVEKDVRLVQNDPTFKAQVLASMRPDNKVILNEYNYQYKII